MNRGIIYIVFGEDYANLAFSTIAYSKKFTDLPISIITNLDKDAYDWKSIGVNVLTSGLKTDKNRLVKTSLIHYTPYDETLYIDVDSVIQKEGIEQVFDLLDKKDMVLQSLKEWNADDKYYNLYIEAAQRAGVEPPLSIYIGGFMCFKKNPRVAELFSEWNSLWIGNGCGRDMPALACAVKKSNLNIKTITQEKDKLFSFGITKDCIVVHRYGSQDLKKHFNMPHYKPNKPFDKNGKNNWKKEHFKKGEHKNDKSKSADNS